MDTHFVVAQRAAATVGRAMVPGAFLVDIFPICGHTWLRLRAIKVQFPHSEARSWVVPWRWLSTNCEGRQEGLG
jgi:hypothetical protein